MRTIDIPAVQKFKEIVNAHEQTQTPPIDISLTETPLRSREDESERFRKFSNIWFFPYKKTIFRGKFHFARRPAFRTAESAIPNLLPGANESSKNQGLECSR